MTTKLNDDLQYVAATVRRQEKAVGIPSIFYMWAVIVLIGFALPDFAPQYAGLFWFIAGIGGGALSWWMGARAERKQGYFDVEEGKRNGYHWLIGGLGYILVGLPMILGKVDPGVGSIYFLLLTGVLYSLAGIHLQRGLLPGGLIALAGFVLLTVVELPYTWTLTGVFISLALVLGGFAALRAIRNGARA